MIRMRAKYTGRCTRCREEIKLGDPILYEPGHEAQHAECPETDGMNQDPDDHLVLGYTPGDQ